MSKKVFEVRRTQKYTATRYIAAETKENAVMIAEDLGEQIDPVFEDSDFEDGISAEEAPDVSVDEADYR